MTFCRTFHPVTPCKPRLFVRYPKTCLDILQLRSSHYEYTQRARRVISTAPIAFNALNHSRGALIKLHSGETHVLKKKVFNTARGVLVICTTLLRSAPCPPRCWLSGEQRKYRRDRQTSRDVASVMTGLTRPVQRQQQSRLKRGAGRCWMFWPFILWLSTAL